MAFSGSTNFTVSAADLITEAFALIGKASDEEGLEAIDMQRGMRHLNLMIKAWPARSMFIYSSTEGTFALVASDVDYVFGAGGSFTTVPHDITQIRMTRPTTTGSDIELREISREDYYRLPNKTTTGCPTQWFYDRQQLGGTLYVWPAPDATAATLKFTYRRRLQDIDNQTNDIDFPTEFQEAVLYGLADRLVLPYGKAGTQRAAKIEKMFAQAYIPVTSFDVGEGEGSIMIVPDGWDR